MNSWGKSVDFFLFLCVKFNKYGVNMKATDNELAKNSRVSLLNELWLQVFTYVGFREKNSHVVLPQELWLQVFAHVGFNGLLKVQRVWWSTLSGAMDLL